MEECRLRDPPQAEKSSRFRMEILFYTIKTLREVRAIVRQPLRREMCRGTSGGSESGQRCGSAFDQGKGQEKNMRDYQTYIGEICDTLLFPAEAKETMEQAWEKICANAAAKETFLKWLLVYDYLLVLCMVLGMAGCGTNQENKEPVSGNVSVETENKENDDVVQNEQIADTGSYPPCVMVDGVIYKDTGYVASMPGCGTMDGEIVSTVAGTELPSENNQSNFGSGYHYQRSSEGQLIVVIDDERIIFRDIEKDDTSIPIEVINFNAKVKEITDDGELLVTHVSTAEGFCQMNDGEYYVSAENLAEDVQVGDIVTIWFNGMIQETYPAQLGVVYRIIKTQ